MTWMVCAYLLVGLVAAVVAFRIDGFTGDEVQDGNGVLVWLFLWPICLLLMGVVFGIIGLLTGVGRLAHWVCKCAS
jgi:hypothetical protein